MTSLILRHLSGSKANQESVFSEDELAEWNAAVEEYRQQRRVRRRWKR